MWVICHVKVGNTCGVQSISGIWYSIYMLTGAGHRERRVLTHPSLGAFLTDRMPVELDNRERIGLGAGLVNFSPSSKPAACLAAPNRGLRWR